MASSCSTPEALTEQEHETVSLIGALVGRWTLFTISALEHAYSWRAGILYRITGYLAPRWRGPVMSLNFLCIFLSMPGTVRMIRIVSMAARKHVPWSNAIFELLWGGSASLVWSLVIWAIYRFSATFSVVSMLLLSFRLLVVRIDILVFICTLFFALRILYPDTWAQRITTSIHYTEETFWIVFRRHLLPICVRLCYTHDGFLVQRFNRQSRRTTDTLRSQQSPEGLATHLDNYEYDILNNNQFRLLRIARSTLISHFECELLVFDLHDTKYPAYTAISYEWGPGSEVRPLHLRIGDKQLAVTESAYRVVYGMAPRRDTCYIWCDFICINQSDLDERASQVHMMGSIYASAAKVTVFLNTATTVDYDMSDVAAHQLQKIRKSLYDRQHNIEPQWTGVNEAKLKDRGSLGWQAVANIFARPYWNRAWIVQEIVLAQELVVMFGDNEFQWDELVHFAEAFQDVENDVSLGISDAALSGVDIPFAQITMLYVISKIKRDFHRYKGLTFRETMIYGPKFNASDPRDNIFAFQGLCSDMIPSSIRPDYRIPPVDLFVNAARELMNDSLWFLQLAGIGFGERAMKSRFASVSDAELPSWAPNWGLLLTSKVCVQLQIAQGHEEFRPTLQRSSLTLSVHSAVFDSIVKVTDFPKAPISNFRAGLKAFQMGAFSDMAEAAAEFQKDLDTFVPGTYPTGINRDDALWRVLLGNKYRDSDEIQHSNDIFAIWLKVTEIQATILGNLVSPSGSSTQSSGGFVARFEEQTGNFMETVKSTTSFTREQSPQKTNDLGLSAEQWEKVHRKCNRFTYHLTGHCVGLKVAFTRKGHMLLVPPLTAPGDEVHFIAFAEAASVLRPVRDEGPDRGKHRLVGSCELYNGQEEVDRLDDFRKLAIV